MSRKRDRLGVPVSAGFAFVGEARAWSGGEVFAPEAPLETEAAPAPSGALRRVLGDGGIALMKGAIGVPEAAVGLADLATGGRVGKALEKGVDVGGVNLGFRPKEAKAALDQMLTPEQQRANRAVQEAQGFFDTTVAALQNPSVVLSAAAESVPLMGAGGVVGRALMKAVPAGGLGARIAAGAAGEGVVAAGSQAESIRQETADGLLTGQQAALAAGSGALTGMLGLLGGQVARRMGIADVDTILVGKGAPDVTKGFARRVLEGAVAEGLLEELLQSVQQQVAQNIALDRPVGENVPQAAVLGALSGGLMGGLGNVRSAGSAARAEKLPEEGPASRAANAKLEATAKAADEMEQAAQRLTAAAGIAAPPAAQPEVAPGAAPQPNGLAYEADPRFEAAPTFGNGAAPAARTFGTQQAANIAIGDAGLMGSHEAVETAPGVFEIRAAGTNAAVVAPGVYELPQGQPNPAPTRQPRPAATPQAIVSREAQPAEPAPTEPPAALREAFEQREADRPEPPTGAPLPTDITGPGGKPFVTMRAAMRVAQQAGTGAEIVPVAGGLVVRKVDTETGEIAPAPAPAAPELPGVPAAPPPAPDPEPLPSDVLNRLGKPFTNRGAAANRMRELGQETHTIAKVAGGFVVRPRAVPPQAVQAVQEQPQTAGDAGAPAPAPEPTATTTEVPEIDAAAHEAASSPLNDRPEPTDAQKDAGNYKVGRVRISGMDVSIETPKGAERRSKADAPEPWRVTMPAHYGYIRGTEGADGDHVDLFIGDKGDNGRFWIINQHQAGEPSKFDEHKVVTGVDSAEEAVATYKASFADGFGDKVFSSISDERAADELKALLPKLKKPKPVKADAEPAPTAAPAPQKPDAEAESVASWVIKERATGKVVMETFDRKKVEALNTKKYEAVPIQEHLRALNRQVKAAEQETVQRGGAPVEDSQAPPQPALGEGAAAQAENPSAAQPDPKAAERSLIEARKRLSVLESLRRCLG